MKRALLFLLILLTFSTTAQVVGTTAVESEEYDLTDEQRWEAQTYVHEGLSQRTMEEACDALKDPDACNGNGSTEFMGIDSSTIEMVSKVYSLFSGAMGMQKGGFEAKASTTEQDSKSTTAASDTKAPDAKSSDQSKTAEKGEDKKDYCSLIPAAGELVATTMQSLGQEEIDSTDSTDSAQKTQLYKAARSHRTRAQTAKIQGTTWGATTACYGYYMTMGGIVVDWKVIAKAAGAGFLTVFWLSEADKQQEYADEVNAIAEALPGTGDCNPHTEKSCYCAQEETQYDTANCLEILNKKITSTSSYSVPCVDKDLNADATCTCVGQENCFDSEFFSNIQTSGLASFGNSSAADQFKSLTNGVLTNGTLSSTSASTSANAKKLLADLESKVKNIPSLNKSQTQEAKSVLKYGLSKPVASLIASGKTNSFGKSKVSSLQGKSMGTPSKARKLSSSKSAGAVLRFNSTSSDIRKNRKKSNNSMSSLLNKLNKKGKGSTNSKVLKFSNKAVREAQITKNKDRPIFEIISRRYQVSGWRRLQIQ